MMLVARRLLKRSQVIDIDPLRSSDTRGQQAISSEMRGKAYQLVMALLISNSPGASGTCTPPAGSRAMPAFLTWASGMSEVNCTVALLSACTVKVRMGETVGFVGPPPCTSQNS